MRRTALHYVRLTLALTAGATMLGAPIHAALGDSGTTTYRWVDAQGVVHYSDTPQPGAERLQIQPAQTFEDQALATHPASADSASQTAPSYQVCVIAQPASQQSFYAPDAVAVSVQLSPVLRTGDRLSVTVDGKVLSPVDDSGIQFQVSDPYRGAHTLAAVVKGPDGQTLCVAPAVTFYVQRPSLISPESAAAGHGAPAAPGVPHAPTVPHN
jgi:hypothetical protein